MRKIYTTDLSDEEWTSLKNCLPAPKLPAKMRAHALREIFDAIFYVLKSGCPWRLLPGDFPPWQTVFYHFRRFRLSGLWHRVFTILRAMERKRNGKDPNPSAAIMDSQSVKTTEESAGREGQEAHRNGYDAHKHIKGRKRPPTGRHPGTTALNLCYSCRHTGPSRGASTVGRVEAAGALPEEDLGGRSSYSGNPLSQWCQKEGGSGSLRSSSATEKLCASTVWWRISGRDRVWRCRAGSIASDVAGVRVRERGLSAVRV